MPKPLAARKKPALDTAKLLDDAADALRDRSYLMYENGELSLAAYQDALVQEIELRAKHALIVATNLTAKLQAAATAGANVQKAIIEAKKRIAQVAAFKQAILVVAALIKLATALYSGNAAAIIDATKEVIKVNKDAEP